MNHCHLSLTTWLLITGPCFFSAQSVQTIRSWLWSIPVWELEGGTARVWGEPLVHSWLFGHSDRLLMLVGRTKRFSVCRSCSSVSTKNILSSLSHSSTFGSYTPKKKYSFNSSHYSELNHLCNFFNTVAVSHRLSSKNSILRIQIWTVLVPTGCMTIIYNGVWPASRPQNV